jgi:Flp pilus assembly secretin CpaC
VKVAKAVRTVPRSKAPTTLASNPTAAILAAKATTIASKLNSVLSSKPQVANSGMQLIARAQLTPDLPMLQPIPKANSGAVPGSALSVAPIANTGEDRLAARNDGLAPIESANESADVVVTPNMAPPTVAAVGANYPLQSSLPTTLPLPPEVDATSRRPLYRVSQGMARILAFKSNILSVFFSDDNVMDARAINARTIAVTGKGAGKSTLAVFLARDANDVVGRAVIYNIEVYPTVVRMSPVGFTDPIEAETAIRTALNDPRVRVSVLQRPDASLVAQLSGGLRDKAEVDAAVAMASLFVPNVISSLYVDAQAPTLEQALSGPSLSGDELLQSKLRSILGNDTIELVALPGGTALKATVDNAAQAESILSLLPTLGRQIQPFIVVRGSTSANQFYSSEHPVLYGEDFEMTRRMREVTGVETVYAVRTARNALAVYGTVRTRTQYDTVRRYATAILPQLQENVTTTQAVTANPTVPGAVLPTTTTTATTSSVAATAPALSTAAALAPSPSTAPQTGLTEAYVPGSAQIAPVQLQMFVRVLDETAGAIRLVTVESNFVEISRNALKDLGVQLGSATLLSETTTPGTVEVAPPPDGSPPGTPGTIITNPGTTTRTIDPTFNLGQGLLGDFAGFGSFSNLNPVRARLTALVQNGAARVLSKPNLTAVEGADAQITIGGVRPVPSSQTNSSGGATQTSVEFRRFGIILTMRPTVTDDDTIILQIRGDVTDLDPTTAINLSGAIIPGERVRSVDTTVTMREGDTLVLGGLITNDSRKQTSKVPILGDIPILGALFRSKRFENNETELAIFLTPRIRRQNASMNTKSGVEMVPSMRPLPSLQDQQENAFGLTTAGQGQ